MALTHIGNILETFMVNTIKYLLENPEVLLWTLFCTVLYSLSQCWNRIETLMFKHSNLRFWIFHMDRFGLGRSVAPLRVASFVRGSSLFDLWNCLKIGKSMEITLNVPPIYIHFNMQNASLNQWRVGVSHFFPPNLQLPTPGFSPIRWAVKRILRGASVLWNRPTGPTYAYTCVELLTCNWIMYF